MSVRGAIERLALAALLMAGWWLVAAPTSAEGPGATLQVAAPVEARRGEMVELRATLLDAGGAPIAGAAVALYERAQFLNVSTNEIETAIGTTDASGVAVLRYLPRRDGARRLVIRFDGDGEHGPATVELALPVSGTGETYTVEPPSGIPGVNRFLVVAVLVVVWGTMLVVAGHVIAIARERPEAGAGGAR